VFVHFAVHPLVLKFKFFVDAEATLRWGN